jgi:adenylate cyclase
MKAESRPSHPIDLAHEREFRLGRFIIRPSVREIVGPSFVEALEPRVMQVLVALAHAQGATVSRADLTSSCWAGRVVSDDAINRCIGDLRRLAARDGNASFTIETIRQVGWRLSAPTAHEGGERFGMISIGPAVAVMPFGNLSEGSQPDYFADGLTEELIAALGRWRSIAVIARNSSFAFKGHSLDARRIAQELGAAYVVEGSVRREADRVRVIAELVDGASGLVLWTNRYDRPWLGILELQDDLAHHIAAAVVPELNVVEQRAAGRRTSNLSAWDFHLRGRAALQEFTQEGNARARELFESALTSDPSYSDAYAGLATACTRDVLLGCAPLEREQRLARALVAALRAVELNPLSAVAHEALSTVHIWRGEDALALAEARIATDLNPSDALILHGFGNKSDLAGDPEGIPRMERAQRLNPRDPDRHSHLCFLARAYVNARRYGEAEQCAAEALRWRPDYPHALFIRAIALAHLGRIAEAAETLSRCDQVHPGFAAGRADWRPYVAQDSNEHLARGLSLARSRD